MNYAEKVMIHQMVQQTVIERKAYDALMDRADARWWFTSKRKILNILNNIIERYAFDIQVISKIADRERSVLDCRKDLNDEPSRLYKAQADLLNEVVELRTQMADTMKSMRHSVSSRKRYSAEDASMMISLADLLIPKLRDLSDVAGLLERHDKPFYCNNLKHQ